MSARSEEVAFGLGAEDSILRAWLEVSKYASGVTYWLPSRHFAPYCGTDYLGLSKEAIPLTYVEVKERRIAWGDFKDVMFPYSKHEYAKRLASSFIASIGVTRYVDGTLVEVDLSQKPGVVKLVTRGDRPGESVKHGFWSGEKLSIYRPTL